VHCDQAERMLISEMKSNNLNGETVLGHGMDSASTVLLNSQSGRLNFSAVKPLICKDMLQTVDECFDDS
jgi:hypothetical protein